MRIHATLNYKRHTYDVLSMTTHPRPCFLTSLSRPPPTWLSACSYQTRLSHSDKPSNTAMATVVVAGMVGLVVAEVAVLASVGGGGAEGGGCWKTPPWTPTTKMFLLETSRRTGASRRRTSRRRLFLRGASSPTSSRFVRACIILSTCVEVCRRRVAAGFCCDDTKRGVLVDVSCV